MAGSFFSLLFLSGMSGQALDFRSGRRPVVVMPAFQAGFPLLARQAMVTRGGSKDGPVSEHCLLPRYGVFMPIIC